MQSLQFKIQIQDIHKPPVWRRVLVSNNITFDEFHQIIQAVFGWEDCHLYQFSKSGWSSTMIYKIPDEYDDDETTQDSRTAFLSEVFTTAKQTFAYIYDFGDDWKHYIVLEEISDAGKPVPVCLAGKGACPPEDCGGTAGYYNLIEILSNPKDQEYKKMKNWLGLKKDEQWDVNTFNSIAVNEKLKTSKL
jgi:hypothetical protein